VVPVFERPKTVRALDRAATGTSSFKTFHVEIVDSE